MVRVRVRVRVRVSPPGVPSPLHAPQLPAPWGREGRSKGMDTLKGMVEENNNASREV